MAGKKPIRRWRLIVIAVFGLILVGYIISYLPRRSRGSYGLTQAGELRYGFGLSVSDLEQWSPDGCWWQPSFRDVEGEMTSRGNGRGYFYSPLIALDRRLSFHDRVLFTADDLGKEATDELDERGEQDARDQAPAAVE